MDWTRGIGLTSLLLFCLGRIGGKCSVGLCVPLVFASLGPGARALRRVNRGLCRTRGSTATAAPATAVVVAAAAAAAAVLLDRFD